MANPLKGEVALPPVAVPGFEGGGTVLLDFNALCTLEQELGTGVEEMGGEALQSPAKMRQVFRVSLEEHHGKVDDRAVGKIIQALGPDVAGELMLTAFKRSFPEAAKGGDADPPKPAAKKVGGTSPAATKSGARSGASPKRSGGKRHGSSPKP
jgi:hypothetical protein